MGVRVCLINRVEMTRESGRGMRPCDLLVGELLGPLGWIEPAGDIPGMAPCPVLTVYTRGFSGRESFRGPDRTMALDAIYRNNPAAIYG